MVITIRGAKNLEIISTQAIKHQGGYSEGVARLLDWKGQLNTSHIPSYDAPSLKDSMREVRNALAVCLARVKPEPVQYEIVMTGQGLKAQRLRRRQALARAYVHAKSHGQGQERAKHHPEIIALGRVN